MVFTLFVNTLEYTNLYQTSEHAGQKHAILCLLCYISEISTGCVGCHVAAACSVTKLTRQLD